jgi:hypothetical protein
MLGVTLHEGWKGTTADLLQIPTDGLVNVLATAPAETIALPGGVMQVDPGSKADLSDPSSPVLLRGSATVVTRGLQQMHVGANTIEGWNGAFRIIVQGTDITIAALTTPVLVKTDGGKMLVPAAMQWKMKGTLSSPGDAVGSWIATHTPQALPAIYMQQELSLLTNLSAAVHSDIPSVDASTNVIGHFLQLPAARERTVAAERMSRLAALLSDLQKGSDASLQFAVASSDAAALFGSPEAKDIIPLLLTAADAIGKQDLLLPYFLSDDDRLLLAEFHPAIRDHAWVTQSAVTPTSDDLLLGMELLPLSDATPDALSKIAAERWQAVSAAFLATRSDAPDILTAIIPLIADQVKRDTTVGYPERADRYASAITDLAKPFLASLSNDTRSLLATFKDAAQANVVASEGAASSSSASSRVSLAIPDLESRTLETLTQAGFMFTSHTGMHGHADGTVDVASVVLGTANGDQAFDFTYDPVVDEVSHIEQGGVVLPYALTLEQYVAWAKAK